MDSIRTRGALFAFGLVLLTTSGAFAQSNARTGPIGARDTEPSPLELRVSFDPTAFPSGGRTYLFYELSVKNGGSSQITLRRLEVVDGDSGTSEPIAVFEGTQLGAMLRSTGDGITDAESRLELAPGGGTVVFVAVALDAAAPAPNALRNRVYAGDSTALSAAMETEHTRLKVFGPPVQGTNWRAGDGPGNEADNHHRRGLMMIDGRAVISRRYAIDWTQVDAEKTFEGDAADARSYHAYGEDVLAVADGRVVAARDGLPDNVPRHNGVFEPAIPITMETVPGNYIVLDVGDGQFAHYLHLRMGSGRVKEGDRVRRGQVLGQVGNSGDAREPHLHFELTTSPRFAIGEGIPYVMDEYAIMAGGVPGKRTRELPLNGAVIDFGDR
jgi:murein DD-endopeptidase MepM/ murein hydrolase activator NlpD